MWGSGEAPEVLLGEDFRLFDAELPPLGANAAAPLAALNLNGWPLLGSAAPGGASAALAEAASLGVTVSGSASSTRASQVDPAWSAGLAAPSLAAPESMPSLDTASLPSLDSVSLAQLDPAGAMMLLPLGQQGGSGGSGGEATAGAWAASAGAAAGAGAAGAGTATGAAPHVPASTAPAAATAEVRQERARLQNRAKQARFRQRQKVGRRPHHHT